MRPWRACAAVRACNNNKFLVKHAVLKGLDETGGPSRGTSCVAKPRHFLEGLDDNGASPLLGPRTKHYGRY